jgi:hypothetical protein
VGFNSSNRGVRGRLEQIEKGADHFVTELVEIMAAKNETLVK